jgi:hypothetical protein
LHDEDRFSGEGKDHVSLLECHSEDHKAKRCASTQLRKGDPPTSGIAGAFFGWKSEKLVHDHSL